MVIKNELEKQEKYNMNFDWVSYSSLKLYVQNWIKHLKLPNLLWGHIDANFLIFLPDSNRIRIGFILNLAWLLPNI